MSGADVPRPFVIGVTGRVACGKTTVLRRLAELGAETIDADAVYHELIVPEGPLWKPLVDRFGRGILRPDGTIDRRALGAVVFADPSALAELDRMTHPAVVAELRRRVGASDAPVVAVDAVKLVESGFDRACDRVWVVTCDPAQQIERLMRRNGLTQEDAERRVAAQPLAQAMLSRADTVIDNSGVPAATRARVDAAWQSLPTGLRAGTERATVGSEESETPTNTGGGR